MPAKCLCAVVQAVRVMAGGEGNAQAFVDLGFVHQSKLNGIKIELDRQFVHGRFQRIQAGHRARAAHGRVRCDVAARKRSSGAQVGHAVEIAGGLAAIFLALVQARNMEHVVLLQRRQLAVFGGGQAHALLRVGPMAHGLEHHLAGDLDLDRVAQLACRGGGEHRVGPGPQLAAKARPQVFRHDPHVLGLDAQHLYHDRLVVHDGLRGFIQRVAGAIEHGNRRVQFDRVVGLGRRRIDRVQRHVPLANAASGSPRSVSTLGSSSGVSSRLTSGCASS